MYAALRAFWTPPPKDGARQGMEYTIRFAFKRNGESRGEDGVGDVEFYGRSHRSCSLSARLCAALAIANSK